MADIRINSLSTTAASTASDDFVAVDGSANGTRKLNAYSPTFGGNLTVSGAGTSSFAGVLAINNASATLALQSGSGTNVAKLQYYSSDTYLDYAGSLYLRAGFDGTTRLTLTSGGNATLTGNLTVSGTGGSTFNAASVASPNFAYQANQAFRIISTTTAEVQQAFLSGGTYGYYIQVGGGSTYPLLLQPSGGNLLIGTTTDVAAYKLNVYGATSANVIAANGVTPDGTKTGGTFTTILGGTGASTGSYAGTGDIAGKFIFDAYGNNFIYEAGYIQSTITTGGNTDRNLHVAAMDFYTKPTASNVPTFVQRLTGTGNVLIGTTTDGGQKLQVLGAIWAGSTSAGGFGQVSVANNSGAAINNYMLGSTYGGTTFGGITGNNQAVIEASSLASSLYVGTGAATSIVLAPNRTAALTLDSSQNATFAGKVLLPTVGTDGGIFLTASGGNSIIEAFRDGSNNYGRFILKSAGVAGVDLKGTGTATFSGAIAIGNTVNTVSPTSPNRTITMVIGGTTYYIHAKTTND